MQKILLFGMLTVFLVTGCIYSNQVDREAYLEKNQHLPEKTKTAVRNKKIFVGMDLASVIASWGYPQDSSKSVGRYGNYMHLRYQRLISGVWRTYASVALEQDGFGVWRVTRISQR